MKHLVRVMLVLVFGMIFTIGYTSIYSYAEDECTHLLDTARYENNGNDHRFVATCTKCGKTIVLGTSNHSWSQTYKNTDELTHQITKRCSLCGATETVSTEYHTWKNSYEYTDEQTHTTIKKCSACGATKVGGSNTHSWSRQNEYKPNDSDTHYSVEVCSICKASRLVPQTHSWSTDVSAGYEQCDGDNHYITQKCSYCGETKKVAQKHKWGDKEQYEKIDDKTHKQLFTCSDCGFVKSHEYGHAWEDTYDMNNWSYIYEPYNKTWHYIHQNCKYCDATRNRLEKHETYSGTVIREATPTTPGINRYQCHCCKEYIDEPIYWTGNSYGEKNYDLDHTKIYRNSKSVTVKLNTPCKGGVVKVKIGNKTYKKKLNDNRKSVKIKIKKPKKYGKKVKIQLIYNGSVIGKDDCINCYWDVVWYAKNVKKGMTKKQVKYTWGPANHIAKSSGGYEHWHYGDGSYVRFKRGKVNYWYSN